MLSPYVPIVVLFALAAAFAIFSVTVAPSPGPRGTTAPSSTPTSAASSRRRSRSAASRFPVKFYLTAMLFIVFDIEIIFLYPWAVASKNARACSGWSRWSCSSSPCSSRTPMCGGAAVWTGTRRGGWRWVWKRSCPSGVLLTSVEKLVNWSRKSSLWPATFGLACCAIEMMASGGARYDLARFGMEVFRASPRQADLMIVAGRVSQKMAPGPAADLRPDGRAEVGARPWACAPARGGMFNNYAIVQGVDHIVPVDMYLPGCPPRPEMLIDAILKLHDKIIARAARPAPRQGARRRASSRSWSPSLGEVRDSDSDQTRTAARTAPAPARPAPPGARWRRPPGVVEARLVRRARLRRHLRLRRPGPPAVGARRRPSVRTAAYFDEVADALEAAYPAFDDAVDQGRRRPRRADPAREREPPGRGVPDAARRPGAALRAAAPRVRRRLPRQPRPAARRSTT